MGELRRLFIRAQGWGDEALSYEANDWLMRTMARECGRKSVTAVHSYEDCSLWQFEEAKRRGKACIYDMPIGYYPWWKRKQDELARRYTDWLPAGALAANRFARPEQKRREMELADLVLAPSAFVERTIRQFHPDKKIARASYGVNLEFWKVDVNGQRSVGSRRQDQPLRFIYAGQCSVRKGIPVLIKAWRKAQLKDAELELVGSWQLAASKKRELPAGVGLTGPVSREELRRRYRRADIFVFPSFFEGFGLVLLEAMACGLPAIASADSAGPDVLDDSCGRIIPAGNLDALVEALRWFSANRDQLPIIQAAARSRAEQCTWDDYRRCVSEAVAPLM
jgi:glycosyltransferase involved in cell wall biosynthesis